MLTLVHTIRIVFLQVVPDWTTIISCTVSIIFDKLSTVWAGGLFCALLSFLYCRKWAILVTRFVIDDHVFRTAIYARLRGNINKTAALAHIAIIAEVVWDATIANATNVLIVIITLGCADAVIIHHVATASIDAFLG